MQDIRIKKTAEILVDYSTKIKKDDQVQISADLEAKDLALEIYKQVLKKGAYPRLHLSIPNLTYTYFKHVSFKQLKKFPKIALYEAKNTDVFIGLGASQNTRELTNINPKKLSIRMKTVEPISDEQLKKRWVIFNYPTNAYAQEANMSLEEFEDFVFNATLLNWKKESKKQDKLKKILDKGKKVKIQTPNTNITFSIANRKAIKCDGNYNMPDGEVFIAPVETTTQGYIYYDFPAIYYGVEVPGIYLEFKNGEVIKAKAEKNQLLLKKMLQTDKGAKYLGEFGIGLNQNIKKFVKNILFDEKQAGTIHLALGRAYKEGGGKNKSAIHWDMIKDMRKNGKLYVDNKLVQKNGKFIL